MDAASLNHKEHLANVPSEYIKEKMEFFRQPKFKFEALPFECQDFTIKAPYREFERWVHPLDPVSIFDLKNWFGVPNEVARNSSRSTHLINRGEKIWSGSKQYSHNVLPQKKNWEFRSLNAVQRSAVQDISRNLLYGYVSPESLETPLIKEVAKYMLSASKTLKTNLFAAPDLIVCPDKTVQIANVPAVYFNNILIYGNGKIKTSSTTKIHAYQIKRVS